MTRTEAKLILIELITRADKHKPLPKINWKQLVSDEQWTIIQDPAKFKVLDCAARMGKTEGSAIYLIKEAYQTPNCSVLFLALTRRSAKRILWRTLKKVCKEKGFDFEFRLAELTVVLPNGSQIILEGADQENLADRFRGIPFKLIVIDEIGAFSDNDNVVYLIDDVLTPRLADFDGTILIQSTPPAIWSSDDLFFQAAHGKDKLWERFTITENPYLPNRAKWIENYRVKRGWSKEHPTYLREYCGKWVRDIDMLVFKFESTLNQFDKLPEGEKLEYILSIDLGFNDPTAFVVLGLSPRLNKIFIVEAYQQSQMIPSTIATEVKMLVNKYHPLVTVADTGGGGKSTVEELNQIHGTVIKAADKAQKRTYIEFLNSFFINKQVLVNKYLVGLIKEISTLQWANSSRKEFDGRFEDHRSDALLYGFREAVKFLTPDAVQEAQPGPDLTNKEEYEKYIEKRDIEQYHKERLEEQDEYADNDDSEWEIFD